MALLTLTSDTGNRDYLVGAVKAALLQVNPEFNLVDITHQVPPFNYPQAAYVCRSAIRYFPEYSYHLILVNLFEKKPEQILLAFHNNQYYLTADNGLLSMILEEPPELIIGIPLDGVKEKNTVNIAAEMGAVINKLINGESIKTIGNADVKYEEKLPLKPVFQDNWMEGQIIFIDNFENVIVNITRSQFEEHRRNRSFKIVFKRDEVIEVLSESYADVPEGEKLAFFNSAGYLEIAINKGNAAGLFGLKGFSEKNQQVSAILQNRLYYQTVRIYFE